MNKIISVSISFFILISVVFIGDASSWEGVPTHKDLTGYAAENSVLHKDKGDYLKNFGFEAGLEEPLTWGDGTKWVKKWLQEGSALEDAGNIFQIISFNGRFMNHFHNPLKDWESNELAGLDDLVLSFHCTGESSLLWAQDGGNQLNFPGGDWSWQQTRDYYYLALTSNTEAERQENFAKTFRGLGHQLHIIQDAAVPAHVRNDAHPFKRNVMGGWLIEPWAIKNHVYIKSLAAGLPIFPDIALDTSYQTLVPITQFIDTIGENKYDGSNPSTSLSIGLSEYTNANFLSDDTIFTEDYPIDDRHYFPYPKRSSTNIQEYINKTLYPDIIISEDGIEEFAVHIMKERDGEIGFRLLKAGYHTNDIPGEPGALYYKTFYLDEKCHEDYAAKLIPRACRLFGGAIGLLLPRSNRNICTGGISLFHH
ncbi:MAG: hypothetical protein JRJ11_17805 [Deltaproteobacteria bacterium]|nr:hypothetical protein [Deltaproteobacteria bacterium]MBW2358769.1 hypothetical protein [Deltaproteobacteria bacterium]